MTDSTPDWALLACAPALFFELESSWDRRDLRRAYGRWIKRFKPDAHPDEFRKIRAGFERLEDELRFQRMDGGPDGALTESFSFPQPPSPQSERTTPSDAGSPSEPEHPEPDETQEPEEAKDERPESSALVALIAERGPASVLRELRDDFPLWWVPRYLRLFTDGDEAASDEVFEQQLVAALRDRPREPVLLNLMRSWVRDRGPEGGPRELLEALHSLPDMTLAVVATPLLRQLAGAGQGELLEAELKRLEVATQHEGRAAFAAVLEDCLLVVAMVLEPDDVDRWLDEIALDRHGRFDVDEAHAEAASRILAWRRQRAAQGNERAAKAGITRDLEAALLELAAGDEATRLDILVALGQRIRSAGDEIYGSLRPHDEATLGLVEGLSIFGLPFDDGADLGEEEHIQAIEATQAFQAEMDERTEGSVLAQIWTLLPLLAWALTAIFFGLLVSPLTAAYEIFQPAVEPVMESVAVVADGESAAKSAEPGPRYGGLAGLIGLGITITILFVRRESEEPLWLMTRGLRWTEHRISLFLYRTLWRRRVIEFAALQPWSGQQLVSVLADLQQGDGSTVSCEIAVHLAKDPALVLILFGRDLEA